MKKILFQDLKALIEVFADIESRRMILNQATGDRFMWRGRGGFHSHIMTLFEFQTKHLIGNDIFDKTFECLKAEFQKIPRDELEKDIINIEKNKERIFNLVKIIEEFEQQITDYYALNTLFQFTNITFNSDILFSKIEDVFEEATWTFIPDNAKFDITEGGKALLFNLPTSASFMFLRALEDCIRKICNNVTREKQRTFGQALVEIEKNVAKFDIEQRDFERQINFLKYIKDEFRNPSAHPDKTFTQKEAEQLFQVINVSIDKIRYLFEKIKE